MILTPKMIVDSLSPNELIEVVMLAQQKMNNSVAFVFTAEEQRLLKQPGRTGLNKILAIKSVRLRTGLGLVEAKNLCDFFQRQQAA